MPDVVCPNCHSVTAPFQRCLSCNFSLQHLLNGVTENTAAEVGPLARAWSEMKRALGIPERGTPIEEPIDPLLRRACRHLEKRRIRKLLTASTAQDEFSVIAKVTDVDKFSRCVKRV